MVHDFKAFPELTNQQLQFYYWDSPHKQIFEDFEARVIKVTDGDTIRVRSDFRDFDFRIRLAYIAAPELKEEGGLESQRWLQSQILGKEITVRVNPGNRVGKWGRLIGDVFADGMSMSERAMREGYAIPFGSRKEGLLQDFDKQLEAIAIGTEFR